MSRRREVSRERDGRVVTVSMLMSMGPKKKGAQYCISEGHGRRGSPGREGGFSRRADVFSKVPAAPGPLL